MSQTPAALAADNQQAPVTSSAVLNPPSNKQRMKFRLMMGPHIQAEVAPDGRIYQKTYNPGSIIESHMDLEKLNGEGMTKKFERIIDNVPIGQSFEDGYRAGLEAAMTQGKQSTPVADAAVKGFNTLHTDSPPPAAPPPTQHRSTQVPAAHTAASKEGMIQTLNSATLDELKRIAAEEEIDLGKARNREDVLKAVKAGMGL